MKFLTQEVALLRYWIAERERIRKAKEAGMPKPWTTDPILQQYRFCNVHREDDKVTRWIRDNWREPNRNHPNMYIAMILARLINWPPALDEIGFPRKWNFGRYLKILQARKLRGDQIWTGAYMVTAGGKRIPKEEAVIDMVHQFYRASYRPKDKETLLSIWDALQDQGVLGMGSFLAAQVVADLKFTHVAVNAPDWVTFCAPGPGSQIGLNHTLGLPLTKQWGRKDFEEHINALRPLIEPGHGQITAQDAQNCLCEFSKYKRGFARSKYPGV